jgi:cell division topological specificity factor MinE
MVRACSRLASQLLALFVAGQVAIGFAPPAAARSVFATRASRTAPAVSMGWFSDFMDFIRPNQAPKDVAVSRLNLMLGADRAALDQDTLIKIRAGIIELVQQFVDIQPDDVILNISTEERKSILTASLAIKGRKVSLVPASRRAKEAAEELGDTASRQPALVQPLPSDTLLDSANA